MTAQEEDSWQREDELIMRGVGRGDSSYADRGNHREMHDNTTAERPGRRKERVRRFWEQRQPQEGN